MQKRFALPVNILLWLWQLPQNLLALCMLLYCRLAGGIRRHTRHRGRHIIQSSAAPVGISLGNFIFVKFPSTVMIIEHELGHCRQSEYLGWLYLPVVGIPSLTMNIISRFNGKFSDGYYKRFPENWADALAGIKRY